MGGWGGEGDGKEQERGDEKPEDKTIEDSIRREDSEQRRCVGCVVYILLNALSILLLRQVAVSVFAWCLVGCWTGAMRVGNRSTPLTLT